MKSITQVSIVYMVAALLLAQPMVKASSFPSFDLIRPYITFENCGKALLSGASLSLVVCSLWKLITIEDVAIKRTTKYIKAKEGRENDPIYSGVIWYNKKSKTEKRLFGPKDIKNKGEEKLG
jgi:hypothetical protein